MFHPPPELARKLADFLRHIEASLSAPRASLDSLICTEQVLLTLAHHCFVPLNNHHKTKMNTLCRKIHVGRQLKVFYTSDWTPLAASPELSFDYMALLFVILLACAHTEFAYPEGSQGLAFKYLNAALAAFDLNEDFAAFAAFSQIQTLSIKALDTFLSKNP